jgi:hypothetical protein
MSCSHASIGVEPLVYAPQREEAPIKVRFGRVDKCVSCHAIRSEPKMLHPNGDPHIMEAVKLFNGTSWSLMIGRGTHRPFVFEKGDAGILVPLGMASGELRPLGTTQETKPEPPGEPDLARAEDLF